MTVEIVTRSVYLQGQERRRRQLEIWVQDNKKMVQVWLTRQEREDKALRQRLKPLYRGYKASGYLVAVFQSGDQDLYRQTSDLLRCNRKRMAELAVQKKKTKSLQ